MSAGRFRMAYGAGPAHLVVTLVSLVLVAYSLARVFAVLPDPLRFFVWLGGGIVAHDLLLLPLYALLSILLVHATRSTDQSDRVRLAILNHLRVPLFFSGLALLVWLPLVLGRGERSFMSNSGLSNDVYLERWLLLSAALFLGSAIVLAIRLRWLRGSVPGSSNRMR